MKRVSALFLVLTLAACSDPLDQLDRVADLDLTAADPVQTALNENGGAPQAALVAEPAQQGGFLGRLLGRAQPVEAPDEVAETPETSEIALTEDDTVAVPVTSESPIVEEAVEEAPKPAGLFGFLRRAAQTGEETPSAPTIETAALAPADAPETATDAARPGLFGRRANRDKPRTGPDAMDVEFGTVLPFGVIARVCDAKGQRLGRKVAKMGARGFTLHDTDPDVVAKRTFYVTGFADGCPRQFTAATASFGAPSMYELLRFSGAAEHLEMGATDKAYDRIKTRLCGVGKRKPCGGKIDSLNKTTAFLTAYEFMGSSAQWAEFLVHKGEVVEAALKARQ